MIINLVIFSFILKNHKINLNLLKQIRFYNLKSVYFLIFSRINIIVQSRLVPTGPSAQHIVFIKSITF